MSMVVNENETSNEESRIQILKKGFHFRWLKIIFNRAIFKPSKIKTPL